MAGEVGLGWLVFLEGLANFEADNISGRLREEIEEQLKIRLLILDWGLG